MAYLVTFHWGWLLASLLLGFAMGWIAVVHRGPGVSKRTSRWLAVLVAALVAAALARLVPGRPGYWLAPWLVVVSPFLGRGAAGVGVAARLGGCAPRVGGVEHFSNPPYKWHQERPTGDKLTDKAVERSVLRR